MPRHETEPEDLHRPGGGTTSAARGTRDERYAKFIDELSKHGNITQAARVAHVSRAWIYRTRKEDPEFAAAWEEAEEIARDALREHAFKVAVTGWNEQVFGRDGQVLGERWKFSERILSEMLSAKCPEFRKRVELSPAAEALDLFAQLRRTALEMNGSVPAAPPKSEDAGGE